MTEQTIRLTIDGTTATITVDRPKALNALNTATLDQLEEALAAVAQQRELRGADCDGRGREGLRRRRRHRRDDESQPRADALAFAARGHRVFDAAGAPALPDDRGGQRLRARRRLRAGAGLRLHLRLREGEVRPARGQPRRHPRLRRHPAAAVGWWAARGPRSSSSPATWWTPHEAKAHRPGPGRRPGDAAAGPCQAVIADDRHEGAAGDRPGQARHAEGADLPLAKGNELEREAFAELFQSADRREGMTAFLEKRPAAFHGT